MKEIRVVCLAAAMALATTTALAADNPAFSITLGPHPSELPLGMPLEIQVTARNASGQPVTVCWPGSPLKMDVRGEDDVPLERCAWDRWSAPYVAVPEHWHGTQLPADWKMSRLEPICFGQVGVYRVRFLVSSHGPYKNQEGEEFEAWEGTVSSPSITIRVTKPEGADSSAYEAMGRGPGDITEQWAELLRRFPTSTYAAYGIWKRSARGTADVDADYEANSLSLGPIHESGMELCDQDGRADATKIFGLSGTLDVECRDNWLRFILEHHPNIWFADEVRLKLALDRYFLGDKDGCAAGLEDLAEHGKPYVASKAGELLAAMRANGMLEEEAHSSRKPKRRVQ